MHFHKSSFPHLGGAWITVPPKILQVGMSDIYGLRLYSLRKGSDSFYELFFIEYFNSVISASV